MSLLVFSNRKILVFCHFQIFSVSFHMVPFIPLTDRSRPASDLDVCYASLIGADLGTDPDRILMGLGLIRATSFCQISIPAPAPIRLAVPNGQTVRDAGRRYGVRCGGGCGCGGGGCSSGGSGNLISLKNCFLTFCLADKKNPIRYERRRSASRLSDTAVLSGDRL